MRFTHKSLDRNITADVTNSCVLVLLKRPYFELTNNVNKISIQFFISEQGGIGLYEYLVLFMDICLWRYAQSQ